MGRKKAGQERLPIAAQTIVVCHNTSRYLWLHYEQVLHDLAKHYERVVCVAPRDGDEHAFEVAGLTYQPIAIQQHGMNPLQEIKFIWDLYWIYKKYDPHVVLNFSIKPCLYGSLAARLSGVKLIGNMVTGLGYVFLTQTPLAKLVRLMVKICYRLVLRKQDLFFFQNPDDASLFKQSGISRSCREVVLPGTGIDTDYFYGEPGVPQKGEARFLYIGRMLKDKGLMEYYLAASSLKKRYPNIKVSLLGPLDENPSAISQDKINQWHDEGVIEYLGETRDVRPYILQSHVFVLPSYREGLPRSGLEAMSMSRPVVTTDAPGCRELVEEGENGYLVDVRDDEQLAVAMEAFITQPERCNTMGAASRKRCCAFFDVAFVSDRILEQLTGQDQKKSDS